jgi:hypothetical protein
LDSTSERSLPVSESDPLPKPTLFDQLFPGRFIKAGDLLGKDRTLTISDVAIERLPTDVGGEKVKGIVSFRESERQWVVNRTNGEALKAMFGRAVREWIGKRVTLYPTTAKFGGELRDAVRVRGSPDLAADMTFSLRLPKKKPHDVTLTRTASKQAAAPESGSSG